MDFKALNETITTDLSDYNLLCNPVLNKGMAFTEEERTLFNLHGLLPPYVATIEEQALRSYIVFQSKSSDLDKYVYLRDLQDSNETLFYYLINQHIEELLPYIYTPVVGEGCVHFGKIYRRPRGLFISYPNRDKIDQILASPKYANAQVIVVSDGERILGLGDQGAGGMGIPIGKLALYTACAGIHPGMTLPILLDTGTDNADRIQQPLYIGWRHERIRGQAYDDFIEQFVQAVKRRFPRILLQWEDFAQRNALPILSRYRDQLCTFNDDIQGTAAIATGVCLAAFKATQTRPKDQKIAIVGGGSAGCGIANLLLQALIDDGLTEQEAKRRFFIIDREGLLLDTMSSLLPFQQPFAQPASTITHWQRSNSSSISLYDVVKNAHPTVLIGVSGQAGLFTEEIVKEMARHVKQPMIFPLSNPTSKAEAKPEDLMRWTAEQAIIGTGSPFPPVIKDGKPFRVDQTNNAYIFPGMGLGVIASKTTRVTDHMFMIAAKVIAEHSPSCQNPRANLLPSLSHIRSLSYNVALAVAQEAVKAGLAPACSNEELAAAIKATMWMPHYVPYRRG
jgi:malate dehydrogenase (oxaloacetate-decarboxylating)